MPQVPYTPYPTDEAAKTPTLNTNPMRIEVPDMTGPGRALKDLGNSLTQAANVQATIALRHQGIANAASENDLYVKGDMALGQLENDLHSLKGGNANGDALKNFNQAGQKTIDDIVAQAPNALVAQKLRMQLSTRFGTAAIHAGDYTGNQTRQYATDAANARVSLAVGHAETDDPQQFMKELDTINSVIDDAGKSLGSPQEKIDQEKETQIGEAWGGHLRSFAMRDQPGALKILEANKDKIPPRAYTKIQDDILKTIVAYGPRTISNDVMQPGLPSAGGVWNPQTQTFLQQRAGARDASKLNPEFGDRLAGVIRIAEEATGAKASFTSMYRPAEVQAQLYANYTQKSVEWGGKTYSPEPGVKQGPAAAPGSSRHQVGTAADLADGPVLQWLHQHPEVTQKGGVEFLTGKTGQNDPGHIQMSGASQYTRGELNNNPTNLTVSSRTQQHGGFAGADPTDPKFARYSTVEDGIRGADQNLLWYKSQGWDTVDQIISHWSPKNENDTATAIKNQAERLGVSPTDKLPIDDPAFRAKFIEGLIQQETSKKLYSADQIKQAMTSAGRVGSTPSLQEAQLQAARKAEEMLPSAKYGSMATALRDAAVQNVGTRHGVTIAQQRDQDLQNSQAVLTRLYGGGADGKPVTSVEELLSDPATRKAYDQLVASKPGMVRTIQTSIQQMNKSDANEQTEARRTKNLELSGMAAIDPQAFRKVDLTQEDLTATDKKILHEQQVKFNKVAEADPHVEHVMTDLRARGLFDKDAPPGLKKASSVASHQFAGQLAIELRKYRETGKEPDDDWVQKKAIELLRVIPGTGGASWNPFGASDKRAFQVEPPEDHKKIITEALAKKGIPATPQIIQYYYRQQLQREANK